MNTSPTLVLEQMLLCCSPQSSKNWQKALEFSHKLRVQLESGYGFESGEPLRFQKQKGIEFTSVSSQHCLLWRGRGGCHSSWDETRRPRDRQRPRQGGGGRAKKQHIPIPWAVNPTPFTPHQILFQFFLLNCNPKHTADVISFSLITGPSELMTFLPSSRETISFCLM